MAKLDVIDAFYERRLDKETERRFLRDIEHPTTPIGEFYVKIWRQEERLLGRPMLAATPTRVLWYALSHGGTWAIAGTAFVLLSETELGRLTTTLVATMLVAFELLQAVWLRKLPAGTPLEGLVCAMYVLFVASTIALIIDAVFGRALPPIFLEASEAVVVAATLLGVWIGLCAGFGLRRKLIMGETTWSKVVCQMVFAAVIINPVGIVIYAMLGPLMPEPMPAVVVGGVGMVYLLAVVTAGVFRNTIRMFAYQFFVMLGVSAVMWAILWSFGTGMAVVSMTLITEGNPSAVAVANSIAVTVVTCLVWFEFCVCIRRGFVAWLRQSLPRFVWMAAFFVLSIALQLAAAFGGLVGLFDVGISRVPIVIAAPIVAGLAVFLGQRWAIRSISVLKTWIGERPTLREHLGTLRWMGDEIGTVVWDTVAIAGAMRDAFQRIGNWRPPDSVLVRA